MGTYIYAVSKSQSKNTRLASGEKVRVHRLIYIYKPYFNWACEKANNIHEACIANMERAWGQERPEYIAFELTDGDAVYRWTCDHISWVDTSQLPAEKAGTLRCSTGGRWTVEPLAPEPLEALEAMDVALAGC